MPGPCKCSISVYVRSLSAAHTFARDWRFVYAFCYSFFTSYGENHFLILHSLWLASSEGWALLECGIFSLLAHCLLFPLAYQYSCHAILLFLPRCHLIHACWAFFGPTVYSSLNWLQCPSLVIGLILMLLWAFLAHYIACGLLLPFFFPWASLAHFQFCIPMGFY